MLKFFREKIFGFAPSQRAGSAEVNSKIKLQQAKRPNSIQSKPKLLNQIRPKPVIQEIYLQQNQIDPNTDRKTNKIRSYSNDFQETINMALSHNSFETKQEQNLLEGLDEEVTKIQKRKQAIIPTPLTIINKKEKDNNFNSGGKQITPQFFSKNDRTSKTRKVLVKSVVSNKNLNRIHDYCTVCKERLVNSDSLQLACTHRYHKTCAVVMQWKMKYTCDLCTNRNGQNQITRK